jgi:hypothetical protein
LDARVRREARPPEGVSPHMIDEAYRLTSAPINY